MSDDKRTTVRVLVADDEADVRDAYRQIFSEPGAGGAAAEFHSLRDRLFAAPAYSDVDPGEIGCIVPPEEKLSYLQKPFHPHEIRQMTCRSQANGARNIASSRWLTSMR